MNAEKLQQVREKIDFLSYYGKQSKEVRERRQQGKDEQHQDY